MFYLYQLHQLELLHKIFYQIVIPQAVVDELKAGKDLGEEVPNIGDYDWIEVRSVKIPHLIGMVTDLGAGEAQVLTLAMENPKSLIIVDDYLARTIAKLQNVKFTGTGGVLLEAKRQGHIAVVTPLLNQLIDLGFWLSNDIKLKIIKLANEL